MFLFNNSMPVVCTLSWYQCEEDGQVFFSLDDGVTKFTDLIQLVEFYQLNRGVLPCKLKHPCTVVALWPPSPPRPLTWLCLKLINRRSFPFVSKKLMNRLRSRPFFNILTLLETADQLEVWGKWCFISSREEKWHEHCLACLNAVVAIPSTIVLYR